MPKKEPREKSGFIVHPFETGDRKYHSSFGNHNKTVKSFKTFKQAKDYLKRNKIKEALYDAPSSVKTISLNGKPTIKKRRRSPSFGYSGFNPNKTMNWGI